MSLYSGSRPLGSSKLSTWIGAAIAPLSLLTTAVSVAAQSFPEAQLARRLEYPTTTIPCPVILGKAEEVEGETYVCGVLTVPEDYDDPDGQQVEITYAVLRSHSLSPQGDPVFVLHGGPGGSNLAQFSARRDWFDGHRQTRDVILFDQRGSQFSSRLGCAPTAFVFEQLTTDGSLGQYIEQNIENDDPSVDNEALALFALCGQILENHGFDLSNFNSLNSAQDVVNLATALGYEDINLYGISYGTYLSTRVMRDYPEAVRSVVLDSALPPQVNKYDEFPRNNHDPILNVLEDCANDEACSAAYPDLKPRLSALLTELLENPLPMSTTVTDRAGIPYDTLTVAQLADNFANWINQNPAFPPYMPLVIDELDQGITATYELALSGDLYANSAEPVFVEGTPEYYIRQAEDFRFDAEALSLEAAQLSEAERPSNQWVAKVSAQIAMMPEAEQYQANINIFGVGYQADKPRDRATLLAYVDETFAGEVAAELRTDLTAMSDAEIRHIYEALSAGLDAIMPVDTAMTMGAVFSVDCREGTAFSDPAITDATYENLAMPLLGTFKHTIASTQYAYCEQWPVEPADPSEQDVLESEIPTLVLQGRYDIQTPIHVGSQVMAGLENGFYVQFPSLGHGLVAYDQCPRDISIAFFNEPTAEPDTRCTAALKPQFVLPSDVTRITPNPPATATPAIATATPSTSAGPTTYTTVVDDNTIRIEIFDGEGFYFRGPLTQGAEGEDYAGRNDWVQVLMNPNTGQVQVVRIGTGAVLFDYVIAPL